MASDCLRFDVQALMVTDLLNSIAGDALKVRLHTDAFVPTPTTKWSDISASEVTGADWYTAQTAVYEPVYKNGEGDLAVLLGSVNWNYGNSVMTPITVHNYSVTQTISATTTLIESRPLPQGAVTMQHAYDAINVEPGFTMGPVVVQ